MDRDFPDLIVLRHGETEWNAARRWQGALDSPLTPLGEAQARAMGAMLARLGIGRATHRVLASPQPRATRTAALAFGPGAEPDARLREIEVGAWTGRTMAEIEADPLYPRVPDLLSIYGSAPGGEGFEALSHRCADLLGALHGPTILVTHGVTGRVLRCLVRGLPLAALPGLTGGQGIAHRIRDGREEMLVPVAADGLPDA